MDWGVQGQTMTDTEKRWRAWKRANPVKLPANTGLQRYGDEDELEPRMSSKPLKQVGRHNIKPKAKSE